MLKKMFWACLLFFSTFSLAYAQTASAQLTQLLENLHTLQADFQQTIQDSRGHVLQQSQGHMALQRPGLFRWETTSPNQQLIIADGKTLWIYDKDLGQVTRQLQRHDLNSPGLLLTDSVGHLASRFTIYMLSTTNNTIGFSLHSKSAHDLFKSVDLYFANGTVQHMQLKDNFGQMTDIQLTNITINNPLNPQLFYFKPPAGIDVVS